MKCKMGGFGSVQQRDGSRGKRRRRAGRSGNSALIAVRCHGARGGKPMHHSVALS